MNPDEIRELATQLILDRARDVKWLTIGERLMDDGLSGPNAVVAAQRVAELIATATITVELPGAVPATDDVLRDRVADAILKATYPPAEWPDGAPGEGEMDTAREEADAVMAVITPELERLRDEVDRRIAEQGIDLRSAERDLVRARLAELERVRADRDALRRQLETESTVSHGLRAERDELEQQIADAHHDLRIAVGDGYTSLNSAAVEATRKIAELRGYLDKVGAVHNGCPNTPDGEHGCPWCRIAELETEDTAPATDDTLQAELETIRQIVASRLGEPVPDGMATAAAVLTLAAHLADTVADRDQVRARSDEADRFRDLTDRALSLRMHGERAPGSGQTWRQWDHDAETALRDTTSRSES